jgi:hypothetical protein
MYGGAESLGIIISTWHEAGEVGINVVKTAIEHGAYLQGSLKAALGLPENSDPEYKKRVIEMLIKAGAKLDSK